MAVQFPTSPNICFYTTWGKQNQQNITFYTRQYYYFIKITRVGHIWFTFRSLWLKVYPNVPLFNCYSQCSICQHFARTQARRRFLHALIAAVSIMFCSRPIQISWLEFIHILERRLIDPLLHDPPELVIDQIEVRAVGRPERRNLGFCAPTVRLFRAPMHWCAVLLKHERVTSDTFDSRKLVSKRRTSLAQTTVIRFLCDLISRLLTFVVHFISVHISFVLFSPGRTPAYWLVVLISHSPLLL